MERGLGGLSRAAGPIAINGNYVAASKILLIQCEKKIGEFEITLLLAIGDREGQVWRIRCHGGSDRFWFRRLARFSGTGWHGVRTRERTNLVLQGVGKGFDTLHRVDAEGETGITLSLAALIEIAEEGAEAKNQKKKRRRIPFCKQ